MIGYIRHCKAGSLDHAGAGATSPRNGFREKAVNAAHFFNDIKKKVKSGNMNKARMYSLMARAV